MSHETKRLPRKGRIWIFIGPPILLVLTIITLVIVRVVLFFCPPSHHSGADLYNSGKYLKYEDGEMFQQYLEELPLSETAEVVSFDYYNFWKQDNYLQADPAPDLYMVHFVLQESPDALASYLNDNGYLSREGENGNVTIYVRSPKVEDTFTFSVIIPHSGQDIYCTLVVDGSVAMRNIENFFLKKIGTAPWE